MSSEPSATITGKVRRNRLELADGSLDRFTYGEAGQLQTFPRDFPWSGSDIGQQIGNAIPPRLAVHVLAAALGLSFDEVALDTCGRVSWTRSRFAAIARHLPHHEDDLVAVID